MELSINGGTYRHISQDVNSQRSINLYPVAPGDGGEGKVISLPTGGLLELTDTLKSSSRHVLYPVSDPTHVYQVVDSNIYQHSIDINTNIVASSVIGTMTSADASSVVRAAYNDTQIIWVDQSTNGYVYNFSTGVFTTITASDDFQGGSDVVFLDGYFLVSKPNSPFAFFSDLNDGLGWNAALYLKAESAPDNIVGLGVYKGELWVIGQVTTEIWYNAGNAPPAIPFSLRKGLTLNIGCSAPESIVNMPDLIMWLDNRGFIVQSSVSTYIRDANSGYNFEIVSYPDLTSEILSYPEKEDAVACWYNYRGHIMYQITFPSAQKTWVIDLDKTSKVWHERTHYIEASNNEIEHLGYYCCQYKTLQLMCGRRNGKLYNHSQNYYDDAGEPIKRVRITPNFSSGYDLIPVRELGTIMQTGEATNTGLGSDPQITLYFSSNRGHTWSNGMSRSMGQTGEYSKLITWNLLGTERSWQAKFEIVEPIWFALISCYVDVG